MAIEYRNVDAGEIQNQVLTNRALDGERQAFAAEMEVQRLATLAKVAKKGEEADAVIAAQRDAEANAASLRSRANRVKSNVTLEDNAVAEVRAGFLNDWVTSLEQEHVAHSALAEQRRASLAMTGAGAPSEEEKVEIQARLEQSEDALRVIESSWTVATTSLDSVKPAPAVAEPTTPGNKPARNINPSPNNAAPVE